MSQKIIRIGDMSTGSCGCSPMPATTGSPNVFANGIPIVRETDFWNCHDGSNYCDHCGNVAQGYPTVLVNGLPVAYEGSPLTCGDTAWEGSPNVFVGGS